MRQQWLSNRWTRITLGLLVGAVAGLATYGAGRLTGPGLYVLAGAAGGVAAAAAIQIFGRNIRLTDITLTVPQLSELHFSVTRDSQQVAWKLFVESVTRISTQPLDERSGLLREAMTSLYGLFNIVREVLKQSSPSVKTGGGPTVEHLAIAMLNNELRPFLSRWHPALLQWEKAHPDHTDSEWPQELECRTELASVQRHLKEYALGFGRLAGLPNAQEVIDGVLGVQFSKAGPMAGGPAGDRSGYGDLMTKAAILAARRWQRQVDSEGYGMRVGARRVSR